VCVLSDATRASGFCTAVCVLRGNSGAEPWPQALLYIYTVQYSTRSMSACDVRSARSHSSLSSSQTLQRPRRAIRAGVDMWRRKPTARLPRCSSGGHGGRPRPSSSPLSNYPSRGFRTSPVPPGRLRGPGPTRHTNSHSSPGSGGE
jgi:hypothetical protein